MLIWVKTVLLENEFKKRVVLSFLKEFAKKQVNGEVLKSLQRKLLMAQGSKGTSSGAHVAPWQEFKNSFSAKNQAQEIWIILRKEIEALGRIGGEQDAYN